MRWTPAVFAIVEGDWRFTQRAGDLHEVLVAMESMPLEKEGDEVRFANLVDRTVLAFQTHDERKGVAYAKELDAWLAAHRSVETSADFDAMRATFASLTSGALRTTDPCTFPFNMATAVSVYSPPSCSAPDRARCATTLPLRW
jgi:hypothetical protein